MKDFFCADFFAKICNRKLDEFSLKKNSGYYKPGGPVFLCIDGEDNPWAPSVGLPHLRLAGIWCCRSVEIF